MLRVILDLEGVVHECRVRPDDRHFEVGVASAARGGDYDGELLCSSGAGFAFADERVEMSYKYRTVRVRGTDLIGTIARKHGSAPEIYETSKDANTSVVPVFFQATGEIRFFDRSMLEDVVTPTG
ncbi:hypothetical protein [Arthrobacter sp. MMS24-S77]